MGSRTESYLLDSNQAKNNLAPALRKTDSKPNAFSKFMENKILEHDLNPKVYSANTIIQIVEDDINKINPCQIEYLEEWVDECIEQSRLKPNGFKKFYETTATSSSNAFIFSLNDFLRTRYNYAITDDSCNYGITITKERFEDYLNATILIFYMMQLHLGEIDLETYEKNVESIKVEYKNTEAPLDFAQHEFGYFIKKMKGFQEDDSDSRLDSCPEDFQASYWVFEMNKNLKEELINHKENIVITHSY
ncbi:MAG: hypothetical protein GQ574_03235 [Crocinitomix sp.]|nr:hypothetical protein [Crocinitomix sp.]